MKKIIGILIVLLSISVLGCIEKQTFKITDPGFDNTDLSWSVDSALDGGAAVAESQGRMWINGAPDNPVDIGSYAELNQTINIPPNFIFTFDFLDKEPWGWNQNVNAFRSRIYIDDIMVWERTPVNYEQSGTVTIDLSAYIGTRTLKFWFGYIHSSKEWPYWTDQAYFRIDNIVDISCVDPTCLEKNKAR